ncbi:allatostatin-A receptor-like [Diadema antillarum]|uniref:allatostatin-A receptor-like n=1 Tax=Diadema antillarum TaxID=105358 RepID=UPI003A8BBBA6
MATIAPFEPSASLQNSLYECLVLLLNIPTIVLAAFGNALVMVSVCVEPSLREANYRILTSLSLADLLFAVLAAPLDLYSKVRLHRDSCANPETYLTVWSYVFAGVSFLHLALVTTDRYLAITRPLCYISMVTPARQFVVMSLVWLAGLVYGISAGVTLSVMKYDNTTLASHQCLEGLVNSASNQGGQFFVFTGSFIIGVGVFLIALNCHILRVAVMQAQRDMRRRLMMNEILGPRGRRPGHLAPNADTSTRHVRAVRIIISLIAAFCLSWYPTAIRFFVSSLVDVKPATDQILQEVSYVSLKISPLVNPLIYCLRDRNFKSTFCKLFPPFKRCFRTTTVHVQPEGG